MKKPCAVRGARSGFTVIELIVVLAMIGVMSGLVGIGVATLQPARSSAHLQQLNRARAEAIQTGRPVRVSGGMNGFGSNRVPRTAHQVLFFPDGSARGSSVDLLTGRPHASP